MLKATKISLLASLLLTVTSYNLSASLAEREDDAKAVPQTTAVLTAEDGDKDEVQSPVKLDTAKEKEKVTSEAPLEEDDEESNPGYRAFLQILGRLNNIEAGDVYVSGQEWLKGWKPHMEDAFYYMDLESAVTHAEKITKAFNIKTDFDAYKFVEQKVAGILQTTPKHSFTNQELELISKVLFHKKEQGAMLENDRVLATKVMFYRAINGLTLRMFGSFQILQLEVAIQSSLEQEELRQQQASLASSSSSSVVSTKAEIPDESKKEEVEGVSDEIPQGPKTDSHEPKTPTDTGGDAV